MIDAEYEKFTQEAVELWFVYKEKLIKDADDFMKQLKYETGIILDEEQKALLLAHTALMFHEGMKEACKLKENE